MKPASSTAYLNLGSHAIRPINKYAIYIVTLIAVLLAYVPYRLIAQHTNTVIVGNSDNFAYPAATFLWPSFAFLVTFLGHCVGRLLRIRWYFRTIALVALFIAWDSIVKFDGLLGIPAGGLLGFRSSAANYPGMNTTYLSVLLCPVAFVFGIVIGEFVGWIYDRKIRRRNAA